MKDHHAPGKVPHSSGPYNKMNDTEQWIRLSDGCPNDCPFCYEAKEESVYAVPVIERNDVRIMDMNLLSKPDAVRIIKYLGEQRPNGKVVYYELVCGIDYRYLTPEIAAALKAARFRRLRLAWDWGFKEQMKIKDAVGTLEKAGYKNKDIMIFMICNWRIPFYDNARKPDLCKVWRVKVADCYFDGQVSPHIEPIYWTAEEIRLFRWAVRKHNQLVTFGIDPEVKT